MTEQVEELGAGEDQGGDPATGKRRIRPLRWLRQHHALVAGAVGLVMSSVVAVVQEQDVPLPWLFGGVVTATALATFVGRAIEDRPANEKIQSLWAALAGTVVFLGGIIVYQQLAHRAPAEYELVVDAQGAPVVYPYAEPDTFRAQAQRPLVHGEHVLVECYVVGAHGNWFYRLSDNRFYLSSSQVRRISYVPQPEIPLCE